MKLSVIKSGFSHQQWSGKITNAWQKSVEKIIETGRLLIEAKAALPHGEFLTMVKNDLPFGPNTAQRLMVVARNPVLANPAHVQHLPASWSVLSELAKLDKGALKRAISNGRVKPDMERLAAIDLRLTHETHVFLDGLKSLTPEREIPDNRRSADIVGIKPPATPADDPFVKHGLTTAAAIAQRRQAAAEREAVRQKVRATTRRAGRLARRLRKPQGGE